MACTMLRPMLEGKKVLELGSGLGLTGLAVAAWCNCNAVHLTDGDPQAVSVIAKTVQLNQERGAFGSTEVAATTLLWGPAPSAKASAEEADVHKYDVIIAADCVYDRALHQPLRQTLRRWLARDGTAICVASRRCGSLTDFERCARAEFAVDNWPADFDAKVSERFRAQKCHPYVLTLRLPRQRS